MRLEWDEAKRQATLRERGLDFADALAFDQDASFVDADERRDYGEQRYITTGPLHARLCVMCWTVRDNAMRVISLRKANDREQRAYQSRCETSSDR